MNDEVKDMLDDCINRESKLSEYDAEFIQAITEYIGKGYGLTPKQISRIEAIWERVTS